MRKTPVRRIHPGLLMLLLPAAVAAQTKPMVMDHQLSMPGMISQHALEQIAEARRVAAEFDTPEKARAAGYRPRFGDVPLQGEHFRAIRA